MIYVHFPDFYLFFPRDAYAGFKHVYNYTYMYIVYTHSLECCDVK